MRYRMIKTMAAMLTAAVTISSVTAVPVSAAEPAKVAAENETVEEGFETLYGDNSLAEVTESDLLWQQQLMEEKLPASVGHLVYGLTFGSTELYILSESEEIIEAESEETIEAEAENTEEASEEAPAESENTEETSEEAPVESENPEEASEEAPAESENPEESSEEAPANSENPEEASEEEAPANSESTEEEVHVPAYKMEKSGTTLLSGANIILLDEMEVQGQRYVKVAAFYKGESITGYVERNKVITSQDEFAAWEKEIFGESEEISFLSEQTEDVWLFPVSYQNDLLNLKALHPNWYFVPLETSLSWESVLDNEMVEDRSWIHRSVADVLKNGQADRSGNWYYPTRAALAYYMDPRNYLNENDMFQFELLTYNAQYHGEYAVELFLNNTFMHSFAYAPGTEKTYARIFTETGANLNVSPLHLASRVYQEQGQGTSPLISGTYGGYEGYYNFFNVGASGSSDREVIVNGLKYARNRGWSNAELSIQGGAELLAASYIAKGQDTLYLQKFNVNPYGYYSVYRHQYMQNIVAAVSEGRKVKQMYENVGGLNNNFVFRIPVYNNMPEYPCPNPVTPIPVNPYPTFGWYVENGNYYWYENGVRQGTEGRGKEIYDPESNAWYWLDAVDGGKKATNKDVYQDSNGGKWVRYDENGRMIKGEDFRYGGWYYFDEITGAMIKGWRVDMYGNRYFYDTVSGQKAFGYYPTDGIYRYFDETTGILAHMRWVIINDMEYWYEDGIRQGYDSTNPNYRGKEIYDPVAQAWFWLDNVQLGAKAKSKEVYQESEAGKYGAKRGSDGKYYGKWVRYDANGYMIKGWYTTEGKTYYYDLVYGTMVHGWFTLDGDKYYFDATTGVMAKGKVKVNGKTYNFDPLTGKLIP